MKEAFASDLLGIDVVIDNASGRYAIIDVNAFPGKRIRSFLFYVLR